MKINSAYTVPQLNCLNSAIIFSKSQLIEKVNTTMNNDDSVDRLPLYQRPKRMNNFNQAKEPIKLASNF